MSTPVLGPAARRGDSRPIAARPPLVLILLTLQNRP